MSRFLRPAYQGMAAYVPGEQPKSRQLVKLNTNENPYPPSPAVLAAVNEAAVHSLNLYSDTAATALVAAIAKRYGVSPEQVVAGNGSDEVLAFSALAFGADGAVFPDITYGFYPVWAKLFGMNRRIVPLREDFTVDIEALADDAAMVFLANPNAPTGIALPLAAVERVLTANPSHVVVVDEAYADFGAESAIPLLKKYENLLVVRTFSKSHSLAGGRVGYAIGNPALISDMQKVRFSFHPYNLNTLSILAGAAAIADEAYFAACRDKIVAQRASTTAALENLGFTVLPSKANFVFARHPRYAGEALYQALRARDILVRWFPAARIRDYLRISIGSPTQMEALLRALTEIVKEG